MSNCEVPLSVGKFTTLSLWRSPSKVGTKGPLDSPAVQHLIYNHRFHSIRISTLCSLRGHAVDISQIASRTSASLRTASDLVRSILGSLCAVPLDVGLVNSQRVGGGPIVAEVVITVAVRDKLVGNGQAGCVVYARKVLLLRELVSILLSAYSLSLGWVGLEVSFITASVIRSLPLSVLEMMLFYTLAISKKTYADVRGIAPVPGEVLDE